MTDTDDLFDLLLDLNHPDEATRNGAFDTLVARGRNAVPPLVAGFDRIGGLARLYVVRALGLIGDPRAVPLLLELVVGDDPDEYVFITSLAVRSLGQIADETAIESLGWLLDHERVTLRRMAATVLGGTGSPLAVPGLIGALRNDDAQTCAVAARSLEQIGTAEARAAVAAWRRQA